MSSIKKKVKKKSVKRIIPSGKAIIFCNFTRNNTRIDLIDLKNGEVLKPNSGGMMEEKSGGAKFSGAKKTAEIVTDLLVKKVEEQAKDFGIREVVLTCKGNGPGRKQALEKLFRSES